VTREINFLGERRKKLTRQETADRRIMMMVGVVLGIMVVVFLIIFGIRLFLGRTLFQRVEAQRVARGEITSNQSLERSFVVFVNKLKALTQIDQDKKDKNEVIQYFETTFGTDSLFKKIEFDQKEKLLVFRLQSNDIFALKKVMDLANSPDVQSKYPSLKTSDLHRSADGTYEVTIAVLAEKK
jgi:hypothetical protein